MQTALDHLSKASEPNATAELTPALASEQSAYQELLKLRQREHQVTQGRNQGRANNANSQRFQQQLQQLQLTQRQNRYETQRLAQSREQSGRSEDLQMLESQQQNILERPDRKLLSLNIDAGGMHSRRVIERIVAGEIASPQPAAAT